MQILPLSQLKKLTNNPRTITASDMQKLKTSIKKFGVIEGRPFLISNRTGENVIIGGNQRFEACKSLGINDVPCHIMEGLTEQDEKEIIIRDNISNGEWDMDLIANEWSDMPLEEWGMELGILEDESIEETKEKGEIEFTEELMESHNYVVLYFDNEIDWMTAVDKLAIKTKKTPDSRKGYERAGIGRVVRGADVISRIA